MRHKNRTIRGDELRREHQARYEKWWLNKVTSNVNPPEKIIKVEYIGNSVYGVVRLTTESGKEIYPTSNYRPTKDSVKIIQ